MSGWKTKISQLLKKILDVRRIYTRIKRSVRENPLFYIAFLAYIVILSTITILKHNVFLTSGFDLGLLNQAFSTTLSNGKLFYETGDLSFNPGGSFFGVHFSPILFLLLPFYAIYPHVENLLVMQTVILALGAFPVYWMTRDRFSKKIGVLASIIYFIYPPLFLLNLNDIHLEPFTSTFFIFAVYYMEKEEWKKTAVFSVLAMLTLEFAPIIGVFVAFYGLWLLLTKKFKNKVRARKYIIATVIVSILLFLIALQSKGAFNTYTSPLPTPFHHLLTDPSSALDIFRSDWGTKMLYLINLLAPLAFLPLLAPEPLIMALPWILASFVTNTTAYYSVYFQYTGLVIPFIFLALPKALERLKIQKPHRMFYVLILSTIILSSYLPSVQEAPWNNKLPTTSERTDLIHQILPLIPADASILTQNDIFPHVSDRPNAYMYLPNSSDIPTTDFILVDVDSPWYDWKQPAQFGERKPPIIQTLEGLETGSYGVYAEAKSVLLLKKGYTGDPVLFIPFDSKYNYQNLSREKDVSTIIEDDTSSSKLVINHDREKDKGGALWFGPYVSLLPGIYRVTYAMRVDSYEGIKADAQIIRVDVTNASGFNTLKSDMVNGSSVPVAGQWFNYTLFFAVKVPLNGVECRGIVWGNYSVSLDYVRLEQVVAQPTYENAVYRNAEYKSVFYSEELEAEQGMLSDGVLTHVEGGILTHVKGSGIFWHGPYANLSEGNYVAKFWLKLDKQYDDTPLLDVDVVTDNGKTLLGLLTLKGSNFETAGKWQSFDVKFTLNDTSIIELRGINVKDTAPISLLSIEVYQDTTKSFTLIHKATFDYEDLPVVKGVVLNATGILTHINGNGTFWRGPYANLPKGEYIARFWLRLDKAYDGVLLDVDVSADAGSRQITFLTLSGFNFEKVGKWQRFDVRFGLNETTVVELRGINVIDTAPISLSSVEVYEDTSLTQQPIAKKVFYGKDLQTDQAIIANNGTFWAGPYANFPKGDYVANFWLKLDKPYNGSLLNLEVTANAGNTKLTSLTVHSSNFDSIGKWKKFELKFTLQKDRNVLEFRGVNVRELAPVSLFAVEVKQDSSPSAPPLIYKTTFGHEDLQIKQGIVDNASGIITHTEGNGTFWQGPYSALPKGDYTARFWLRLDAPYSDPLLDVDVATNAGQNATFLTLSGSNFERVGKWQGFNVNFTLQSGTNIVEFRGLNVKDTAPVSLLSIEVFQDATASQPTPKKVFYSADLEVKQGIVDNASGIMTHTEGNGTFWQGPYTPLRKGNYVAKFWLKLDRPYNGTLLDVDVAVNAGHRLRFVTLSGFNFGKINEWQSFEIKFSLSNSSIVEFRGMYVRDTAPISLQSIEVYPDTGG